MIIPSGEQAVRILREAPVRRITQMSMPACLQDPMLGIQLNRSKVRFCSEDRKSTLTEMYI